MHGPVWNDNRVGVTGEPKFRTQDPNYVTVHDARSGETQTVTGDTADEIRAHLV